jgi:hypothetical protein
VGEVDAIEEEEEEEDDDGAKAPTEGKGEAEDEVSFVDLAAPVKKGDALEVGIGQGKDKEEGATADPNNGGGSCVSWKVAVPWDGDSNGIAGISIGREAVVDEEEAADSSRGTTRGAHELIDAQEEDRGLNSNTAFGARTGADEGSVRDGVPKVEKLPEAAVSVKGQRSIVGPNVIEGGASSEEVEVDISVLPGLKSRFMASELPIFWMDARTRNGMNKKSCSHKFSESPQGKFSSSKNWKLTEAEKAVKWKNSEGWEHTIYFWERSMLMLVGLFKGRPVDNSDFPSSSRLSVLAFRKPNDISNISLLYFSRSQTSFRKSLHDEKENQIQAIPSHSWLTVYPTVAELGRETSKPRGSTGKVAWFWIFNTKKSDDPIVVGEDVGNERAGGIVNWNEEPEDEENEEAKVGGGVNPDAAGDVGAVVPDDLGLSNMIEWNGMDKTWTWGNSRTRWSAVVFWHRQQSWGSWNALCSFRIGNIERCVHQKNRFHRTYDLSDKIGSVFKRRYEHVNEYKICIQ